MENFRLSADTDVICFSTNQAATLVSAAAEAEAAEGGCGGREEEEGTAMRSSRS